MKSKHQELVPVGINAFLIKKALLGGYVFSVITSVIIFLSKFFYALGELYYYDRYGERKLYEDIFMKDFSEIRKNAFDVFVLFAVCLAVLALYNFLYHYQESKSIYTMKRLKTKSELYKRCLAFPLLFIFLSILTVTVLNFLYLLLYIFTVPEECILSSQKMMWRF